jgi:predicted acylesterase/phospholipase RssA
MSITSPESDQNMTEQQPTRYVNGVFKGGGAKGVAYAGALQALEKKHIWFKSVAGASAGAITASLIAAGMLSDEVTAAVPKGLEAAGAGAVKRGFNAVFGHERSIFGGKGLREWLDAVFHERTGKADASPVTFAELYEVRQIELYVVVLDVSNGQPVVFNRRTTPNVEVAGAVVSSSAIPGAFPAGRGVFGGDHTGTVTHQFVDGGAWANYPAFVFEDHSFRAWLAHVGQLQSGWDDADWDAESARPVVGFILGDPVPLEQRHPIGMIPLTGPRLSRRFDQGPSYTSNKPASFIFGSLLSSNPARTIIAVALAIWMTMSVVTLPIGLRRYSTWLSGCMPSALFPAVLVVSVIVVVFAAVLAIVTLIALVTAGRLIADTVLPTVQAIMAVPTDVAPWLGKGPRSVVLRVPHDGLETTEFSVKPDTRDAAVTEAYKRVKEQLEDNRMHRRIEALLAGQEPADDYIDSTVPTPEAVDDDKPSATGFLIAVALILLVSTLGTWVTDAVGTEGIGRILVLLLLGLIGVGGALVYLSKRTELRANHRARRGITDANVGGRTLAQIAIAAGALVLVGGIALSRSAMNDRAATTSMARVTASARNPSGPNHYTLDLKGSTVSVDSSRHLRLGERVFVNTQGTGKLVGPLDNVRFGWALALWMLGLGLITSGIKRHYWVNRCRRLVSLAQSWTSQG